MELHPVPIRCRILLLVSLPPVPVPVKTLPLYVESESARLPVWTAHALLHLPDQEKYPAPPRILPAVLLGLYIYHFYSALFPLNVHLFPAPGLPVFLPGMCPYPWNQIRTAVRCPQSVSPFSSPEISYKFLPHIPAGLPASALFFHNPQNPRGLLPVPAPYVWEALPVRPDSPKGLIHRPYAHKGSDSLPTGAWHLPGCGNKNQRHALPSVLSHTPAYGKSQPYLNTCHSRSDTLSALPPPAISAGFPLSRCHIPPWPGTAPSRHTIRWVHLHRRPRHRRFRSRIFSAGNLFFPYLFYLI